MGKDTIEQSPPKHKLQEELAFQSFWLNLFYKRQNFPHVMVCITRTKVIQYNFKQIPNTNPGETNKRFNNL